MNDALLVACGFASGGVLGGYAAYRYATARALSMALKVVELEMKRQSHALESRIIKQTIRDSRLLGKRR